MGSNTVKYFIISTFVTLYLLVSVISTIHVISFFELSNPQWLAISLAIAFEIGAAASLASLITLDKMNKGIVWGLFIILTCMQAMGNTYYAYINLENFQGWIELFGLSEEDPIYQKRILSIVSGAILPVIALGFIKALVDYIKPSPEPIEVKSDNIIEPDIKSATPIINSIEPDPLEDTNTTYMDQYLPSEPAEPVIVDTPEPNKPRGSIKITDSAIARGFSGLKKPFDP